MRTQAYRRRRVGFTLIELLVVVASTVLLSMAISYAFSGALNVQRLSNARKATTDSSDAMEQKITQLIKGTRLSSVTTDTTSYFQGVTDSGTSDLGCDRITFTTTAPGVPMASSYSTDDYPTQQTNYGPVGGLAEVSLGTTAVGDAGTKTGLFERLQQPSDADPTQGGNEFVIDPDVDEMGFQFWDGLEWIATWDTTTGTRRLPAAVQVSYRLKGESGGTAHMFVVQIPTSDVTATNPMTQTSTTATSTATTAGG